ncbi:hypothetical protein [Ralstonia mannitolilytica]|uniref:hypothetical protein n=1 Tax=Ralstonia mannitolilytica TaxID=105219 RepID=UPI00292E71CB|nr:hypothetical protein [Ralstonia mannitolilytica]
MNKAQAMGVRLILNGDGVKLRGPAASVVAIQPELAVHKSEIVAHLRHAASGISEPSPYPMADGPYMPYAVPLSCERVAELTTELRTTIGKVADIEGWPDAWRTRVLGAIARQPLSTLADDCAYFRERLGASEAVARAISSATESGFPLCVI